MNSQLVKSVEHLTSRGLVDEAAKIAQLVLASKSTETFQFKVPQAPTKVVVHIHNQKFNNDDWAGRVNTFDELTDEAREELFAKLTKYSIGSLDDFSQCHTEYERSYIEELVDFRLHETALADPHPDFDVGSYYVETYYKLQWPLKMRKFTNLLHIAKSKDGHSAYVIGVAVHPSVIPNSKGDDQYVLARYTSVELVQWDPDTKKLKWVMTTCSNAEGNVPQWLAKRSINGVIAKDVPHFLNWVAKQPAES